MSAVAPAARPPEIPEPEPASLPPLPVLPADAIELVLANCEASRGGAAGLLDTWFWGPSRLPLLAS